MSTWSRPRRSRLPSRDRRIPSRLKSQLRRDAAGTTNPPSSPRCAVRGLGTSRPAHFGGDGVLGPGTPREGRAEAAFGQPEPVVRGRVEVADAAPPGRVDGARGVLVARDPSEVAQLCRAEAEFCQSRGACGASGTHVRLTGPWRARRPRGPPGGRTDGPTRTAPPRRRRRLRSGAAHRPWSLPGAG